MNWDAFIQDTRGQSVGLARFVLSLLVGVPVIWITWEVSDRILPGAKNATSNSTANQATDWIGQSVDFMPVWFLLVAFFGIIVLSVYQREILR